MVVINGSNPDYINTKMEDHSWYVGNMDRDSANAELEDFPQVRIDGMQFNMVGG